MCIYIIGKVCGQTKKNCWGEEFAFQLRRPNVWMTETIDSCHSGSYQSRNGPIRSRNGKSLKRKKLANPSPRIAAPDRQLPLTIDVKDYKIINSGIGRRKGLKIPRWLSNVPVRVRPSALSLGLN